MVREKTLSIIKPDAVSANYIGNILSRFEQAALCLIAIKMVHLHKEQAEQFYAMHRRKNFFHNLVVFMISGPIVVSVLEGDNAINRNRELMGATNPAKAAPGTIRADFAKTIDANAVHGSDGVDSAKREIEFFFKEHELFLR